MRERAREKEEMRENVYENGRLEGWGPELWGGLRIRCRERNKEREREREAETSVRAVHVVKALEAGSGHPRLLD